ncbi:hypothetical protein CHU98_g6584 [Xylaria longipes]|nr:hypothetical protein CHU98_g6584 [Xylaria longipes]
MPSLKLVMLLLVQGSAQALSHWHPSPREHMKLRLPPRGWNMTSISVTPTSFSTLPAESPTSSSPTNAVSSTAPVSSTLSLSSSPSLSSNSPSSSTTLSLPTSDTDTNQPSSQPATSQSTTEEFSATPVTSFPAYTAPTSTITGASETSSAAAIAPLFIAVWQDRGNLLDSKKKDQYIKDVTETKHNVDSLNSNLADKSDPPNECSNTSGSGSLISGIKNLLTTPAKLISCAAAVVSNLVDAVSVVNPVISTVEVLTDTLMDISNELEKSQNEDPTSSNDQATSTDHSTTSTATSSSSECSVTAAPSCAETISLSTLFYTDSTTTTSEVKTITTMVCATITASCATGTTATTTVSTATTSSGTGWICDQTCAAGGCQASKRAAQPTAVADPEARAHSLENRNLKPTAMIPNVDKYIIQTISASNAEGLDWSKGIAVAKYYQFLSKGIARYVAGVTGCTSIIIASEKGVWLSHFTETGLMDDSGRQTERDSLDNAVKNGNDNYQRPSDLAGEGGDLNKDTQSVQIYVSAPCTTTTDGSGKVVCTGDEDAPSFEYPRIDELLTTLFGAGTPFDGVSITKRGYIKPVDRDEVDALADTSARGKAVVQYDPNQLTEDFLPYKPKHAAYRVWLESTPYQEDWVASACQGGNDPNQKRDVVCPISGGASPTVTSSMTVTSSSTGISSTSNISTTVVVTPLPSDMNTTMVTMTMTPVPTTKTTQITSISTSEISTSDTGIDSDTTTWESDTTASGIFLDVILQWDTDRRIANQRYNVLPGDSSEGVYDVKNLAGTFP